MIIFKNIFIKIAILNLFVFNALEMYSVERTTQITENEAIAYFILNCAYFTVWQAENDPYQSLQLKIAVIAQDDLINSIKEVAAQAKKTWFKDGEIIIDEIKDINISNNYHIVYIAENYDAHAKATIEQYKNKNTLLIGSINKFIQLGGAVELSVKKSKLNFDLNLKSLQESRIELKSGLKKRARKIYTTKSNSKTEKEY